MNNAETLGDILFAEKWNTLVLESDWLELVQSIHAGNQLALHALIERSQDLVFALILRIRGSRKVAEELTADVFWEIWRSSSSYEAAERTVLGWIMDLARSKATGPGARLGAAAMDRSDAPPDPALLHEKLARRMAAATGGYPLMPVTRQWSEPAWKEVAAGISCKFLSTDTKRHRVSMLVRLSPGAAYPGHTHADSEELHLLEGELWIDDRQLFPGDHHLALPGTQDRRVWSHTGCIGVLLTSTKDRLSY